MSERIIKRVLRDRIDQLEIEIEKTKYYQNGFLRDGLGNYIHNQTITTHEAIQAILNHLGIRLEEKGESRRIVTVKKGKKK